MIGVVSLGTSHYEELIHQEGKGIFEFASFKREGGAHQGEAPKESESETIYGDRPSPGFHRMDTGRVITVLLLDISTG